MIDDDFAGLLVLRSLTKTWGLAGLRAGYVIGDPKLIAAMRLQQPPWSVSTPALAAMVACLTPTPAVLPPPRPRRSPSGGPPGEAVGRCGSQGCGSTTGPFVLVDTSGVRGDRESGWVRLALRDQGFAVRRGRPSPASGPIGSESPYANPKPLTSS